MNAKEILAELDGLTIKIPDCLRATIANRLIAYDKFEAARQAIIEKKKQRRAARKTKK